MTQELISMTEKEFARHSVMKNLIAGDLNGTDAAKQIGISTRQVRRIKAKVIKYGIQGLIHGNRGRKSNRKLNDKIVESAKRFLKEKYYYLGSTFAAEKLNENHKIKINKETLRIMMNEMGLRTIKPRKNPKNKHFWRPRKDNFGEMEQFDGSYHNWFGNEESCLLLSVDDATGKITHGQFGYNESVKSVFAFWVSYLEQNGLPLSIYLDKFSTYKVNHKNALDNSDLITQFQRASNQLGIKLITAHSPEAKGRIERMFQTLQDRLVKELRLVGIADIGDANKFLQEYIPKFNVKFAVIPNRRQNLHKKLDKLTKEKLPQIFSVQNQRKVNNDYTVMFKNHFFQLDREQPTTVYKKDIVIVEEHLDGTMKLCLGNHYLNYTVLPERPKKEINVKLVALTKQIQDSYKPPADHPWRRPFLFNQRKNEAVECVLTRATKSR